MSLCVPFASFKFIAKAGLAQNNASTSINIMAVSQCWIVGQACFVSVVYSEPEPVVESSEKELSAP